MKHILFILLFSVITLSIAAQNSTIDDRLLTKYSKQELKTLQTEQPEELQYITYCIENAYSIGSVPQEKIDANISLFKEIELSASSIENFYTLGIAVLATKAQYFLIKGTKKVLTIKSKDQILLELKK